MSAPSFAESLAKRQAELRDRAALLSTEPTPDGMLDMANLIGDIVDLIGSMLADRKVTP